MELFIVNLSKMIIIIDYADQSSTILTASTWSIAVAYAEGTGKDILQIFHPQNGELILNSPSSTTCYQVVCKNTETSVPQAYFVFEDDFQSLNTWIESLSNIEVRNLSKQQRNYVSL
jgi:hypothetical protein